MLLQADIANLKSNMDRFIATPNISVQTQHIDLKSNMDRFIVYVRIMSMSTSSI